MTRLFWTAALATMTGAIGWLGSRPVTGDPPSIGESMVWNFLHYPLYGAWTWCACAAWCAWPRRDPAVDRRRGLRWMPGLTVLVGVLDEFHQSTTAGRTASWTDVVTDGLAGVGVTALFVAWMNERSGAWQLGGWTAVAAAWVAVHVAVWS